MSTPHKKPARRPTLAERNPLGYAKALRTFAASGDVQKAAEEADCHADTIKRMLARDSDGFAMVKKELARRALELSALAQARATATTGQLSPMQAVIASKVASQQAQELLGDAPPPVQVNVLQLLAESTRVLQAIQQRAAGADAPAKPTATTTR